MLTGNHAYGYVNGESLQHVLLARAWRDLGLDVSIVVYDHGQPTDVTVDGVRAIAAYRPQAGVRVLRFVHPRVSGVIRAMREARADVYYQSPAGAWSGVAAWFARRVRARFILRIASDLDCMKGRQPMRHMRDRRLFDYGVRNASLLAAQTEQQRLLLQQHYGVDSRVVNIAAEIPEEIDAQRDVDVLWVGNLRRIKRADRVIELARRLPHRSFVIVGGSLPGHEQYYREIATAARALPNVVMTGAAPYERVGEWFGRARLHLNTSDVEGFPNTFLQAWGRRVPVVSLFDPDGVIEQRRLGRACAGVDQMARVLEELLTDPAECDRVGARARAYVAEEFDARRVAARYLELLQAEQGVEDAARLRRAGAIDAIRT